MAEMKQEDGVEFKEEVEGVDIEEEEGIGNKRIKLEAMDNSAYSNFDHSKVADSRSVLVWNFNGESKEFIVSEKIVAAASVFLAGRFAALPRDLPIELSQMEHEAFLSFLRFVYAKNPQVTAGNFYHLGVVAERLDAQKVFSAAADYVSDMSTTAKRVSSRKSKRNRHCVELPIAVELAAEVVVKTGDQPPKDWPAVGKLKAHIEKVILEYRPHTYIRLFGEETKKSTDKTRAFLFQTFGRRTLETHALKVAERAANPRPRPQQNQPPAPFHVPPPHVRTMHARMGVRRGVVVGANIAARMGNLNLGAAQARPRPRRVRRAANQAHQNQAPPRRRAPLTMPPMPNGRGLGQPPAPQANRGQRLGHAPSAGHAPPAQAPPTGNAGGN